MASPATAYRKKRSRSSASPSAASGSTSAATTSTSLDLPAPKRSHTHGCSHCPILRDELAALRDELERERDLRTMEETRSNQTESRLRRQLTLASEDAEELRSSLEEVRKRAERDVKKARKAHHDALNQLRSVERERDAAEGGEEEAGEETEQLRSENEYLRDQLEASREEATNLRSELKDQVEELERTMEELRKQQQEGDKEAVLPRDAKSDAPTSLLLELQRTRVERDALLRTKRQLTRKMSELQSTADSAVRHREEASSIQRKLDRAEAELAQMRKEREEWRAAEGAWAAFRVDIDKAFGEKVGTGTATGTTNPPEVSTILRKFRTVQDKLQDSESALKKARADLATTKQIAAAAEQRSADATAAESDMKKRLSDAESKADRADLEMRKIQAQEGVWKREAESLRSLLETYERAEVRPPNTPTPKKAAAATLDADGPTVRGLRTSLNSAQERIRLLTKEQTTLKAEASQAKTDSEAARTELDRVKEKFGKLRDALFKEREIAEKAEDRACQAETLAGKGSFDPKSSRVLHLKQNPLMDAVRAKYESEIDALRKALEEKDDAADASSSNLLSLSTKTPGRTPPSGGASASTADQSNLDAQKLHLRLKESFREQIAKFREGVYLLTGFKIDMMSDSTPIRFKVRSMYAEREDDHLIFAWPKVKKGQTVEMLDLLSTPQAELLSQDSNFAYVTKYKSIPCFLANVQLMLFEKQTFQG